MLYSNKRLIYFFIILFFVTDVLQFFFFDIQWIYFLLNFFCLLLFIPFNETARIVAGFLLCVESWALYGRFGICLLYIIPLSLFSLHIMQYMYQTTVHIVLTSALSLVFQLFLIQRLLLGQEVNFNCTLVKFFATIIVIGILAYKKEIFYRVPTP